MILIQSRCLQAGANPDITSCGSSPLACAAGEGEEFIRSLLAAGANPNSITTVSFYFCLQLLCSLVCLTLLCPSDLVSSFKCFLGFR